MRLENKVAIITGAGGGMGLEFVKRFTEEGAKVVALDLNVDSVQDLLGEAKEHMVLKIDITNESQIRHMVDQVLDRFGRIDILANVAGIPQSATPVEDVTRETWDNILNVNVTAPFLLIQAVVPTMKKQNKGAILNISSIAAVRPRPGLNAYITSKGALLSLTEALALELAPHNIRVNAINPGPADTQMLGKFAAQGADVEEVKSTIYRDSVPLGRLIEPLDIANAAVYMCSDEAEIMTGSIVNVDGGRGL